jgi:hypothetical protein
MPYLANFPGVKPEHEFEDIFTDDGKTTICRVCLNRWKRKPNHGKCAGVPIYEEWDEVPNGLVSKSAIYRDHKRKLPDNALPVACVRSHENSFTPLYLVEQGNPNYEGKRKSTKAAPEIKSRTKQKFDPFGWLNKDSEV